MNKGSERRKEWVKKNAKICPICGNEMYYRSQTCKNCIPNRSRAEEIKAMTLGEYKNKTINKGKHPSWVFAEIRNFARTWNKDIEDICKKCLYDKHVEVCHIKPISSFRDSDLIGEINSKENILKLCPNCHWEFDNELISIEEIRLCIDSAP